VRDSDYISYSKSENQAIYI